MGDLGEDIWDVSSWTRDLNWKDAHLRKYFDALSYEECIKNVLDIAETYFRSVFEAYSEEEEEGVELDFPLRDIIILLTEEYFYGHYFYGVTPLQELRLLEIICRYFQESVLDSVRYFVFDCLFGLPQEVSDLQKGLISFKMNVICKLTSIAVGTSCSHVLNCVAVWLYTYGSHQHRAAKLAYYIINEYFFISHASAHVIRDLIHVSPVFTYQLMTSISNYYMEFAKEKNLPPIALMKVLADWMVEQPNFCSVKIPRLFLQLPSVHQFERNSKNHSFQSCPILRLVEWCLEEPFLSSEQTEHVFSKLHYAFLNFISSQKKSSTVHLELSDDLEPGELLEENDSVELITKMDIAYLLARLREKLENYPNAKEEAKTTSTDRLLQVIQVAKWSSSLGLTTKQLLPLLSDLPRTRLMSSMLQIV